MTYDKPIPGLVEKAANLEPHQISEADLKAINRYTLEPLTEDDVFVFKTIVCDNALDRQHERLTLKTLSDLRRLLLGKPVLKDHARLADCQIGRIYATELVENGKTDPSGEAYTQLVAKCYMVKTQSNADLIAEIRGGIKKEGSIGFIPATAVCSICGMDNRKTYCSHFRGRSYGTPGGGVKLCTYLLDGAKDALEYSMVAVPAQKAAGVTKSYGHEIVFDEDISESEEAQRLALRARAFLAI